MHPIIRQIDLPTKWVDLQMEIEMNINNRTATPIRILGIVGSPRRNGNTEILVDQVLQGAAEAGASTEKVILNELTIKPCQACDACEKTGKCAHKDDMHALLELMEASQVWVLGTPVYWLGPTAQFKAFLDRWRGATKQVRFEGRDVVLAIPLLCDESYTCHTVGMLTYSLNYLRANLTATILAPGIYAKGAIRDCTAVLAQAHQAGREAVQQT